jgi:dTDP-4-amino-4,6-dideoxygalactose transaminase
MKINFIDLKKQYLPVGKQIEKNIKKILKNGDFVLGKTVESFEGKLAAYCGAKYAISVNSGTDALVLTLKALEIKNGDEVITSPFTFFATAEAIASVGATPVFADIDPRTFNIDADKIEEKISPRTKAIMPVHIFGQPAEIEKIMEIARAHKLAVIEDAAQAIGAEYKNKKIGSVGDFTCFSFYPTKNLSACGDGGAILTNTETLAQKIKTLRNHGSSPAQKYLHEYIGMNSRLDAIQAAVLSIKLKYLDSWNKKRIAIARCYRKELKNTGDIILPYQDPGSKHVYHQYTIRTKERNALAEYLKAKGIASAIYYSIPLHLQPALNYLGYKKGDLPEAEKASQEVLSLPIYPELNFDKQKTIVKNIKQFYSHS